MKYCKKCGKHYRDSYKCCDSCKGPLEPCSKNKKDTTLFAVLCALALVLLIIAAVLIVRKVSTKDSLQYDAEIAEMMEQVFNAADSYEDSSGCVAPEDFDAAINAVYNAACSEDGVVNCSKDEYGVYIEVENGPDYVYCPTVEGYDAGGGKVEIVTMQPYYTENIEKNSSYDHGGPDLAAANLEAADKRFSFDMRNAANDDDVNDSEVTMERILSLDDYGVILWQGHGGYTRKSGYFLCTNIAYNKSFCKNYGYIDEDDLCIYSGGKVGLKPSFFQNNFEDGAFDNAFVYIATCYSGKDSKLTEAFLDKGAAVVFSNSRSINRGYNLKMMHFISESFFCGTATETVSSAIDSLGYAVSLEPHQTWDIDMSLNLAKMIYGDKDTESSNPFFRAEVTYSLQPNVKRLTYSDWVAGFDFEAVPDYVDYEELFADDISWSGMKTFVDDGGYTSATENVSYRCPQLDTSKGNFEYVNSLIYDEYRRCLDANDIFDGIISMTYELGGRGDVVSILLRTDYCYENMCFYVYNVRISTGELLSDEEFLSEIGCSDYRSRLSAAAGQMALDLNETMNVPQEYVAEMYNSTVSDDNLSKARPLIVGDRLTAICPICIPAGKGSSDCLIDLE